MVRFSITRPRPATPGAPGHTRSPGHAWRTQAQHQATPGHLVTWPRQATPGAPRQHQAHPATPGAARQHQATPGNTRRTQAHPGNTWPPGNTRRDHFTRWRLLHLVKWPAVKFLGFYCFCIVEPKTKQALFNVSNRFPFSSPFFITYRLENPFFVVDAYSSEKINTSPKK